MPRSRSLCQNFWHDRKGLITRSVHLEYESIYSTVLTSEETNGDADLVLFVDVTMETGSACRTGGTISRPLYAGNANLHELLVTNLTRIDLHEPLFLLFFFFKNSTSCKCQK